MRNWVTRIVSRREANGDPREADADLNAENHLPQKPGILSAESVGILGAATTLATLAGFRRASSDTKTNETEEEASSAPDLDAKGSGNKEATLEANAPSSGVEVEREAPLPRTASEMESAELPQLETAQALSQDIAPRIPDSAAQRDQIVEGTRGTLLPDATTVIGTEGGSDLSTELPVNETDPEPPLPELGGSITDYRTQILEDRTIVTFEDLRPESPDGIVEVAIGTQVIFDGTPHILIVPERAGADLTLPETDPNVPFILVGEGSSSFVAGPTAATSIDLSSGTLIIDGVTHAITGVTEIVGSAQDDVLIGNAETNAFTGGAGSDRIDGGQGHDQAYWDADLAALSIAYDEAGDGFTISDGQASDEVTGVETFILGGTSYSATELRVEAERQANTSPASPDAQVDMALPEDSAPGTLVARLSATDLEADELVFAVTDAQGVPVTQSPFEIHGSDVRLSPEAMLDYETADTLVFYVTASDQFTTSVPTEVTITVSDVAEEILLTNVGGAFVDTGVAETSITGSSAADDVTLHADGGVIMGQGGNDTLVGNDGADTAIWSGQLSDFAISYDATADVFTISDLNATDGDEGTDTVTGIETFIFDDTSFTRAEILLEAERQANTGPGAPSIATGGDVAENSQGGAVVATLTATDADGDALSYQITDADGLPVVDSNFEIRGNDILVKAGADLDFETAQSHDLYVTVSDSFVSSGPLAITVTVSDVAEELSIDGNFVDTGLAETSVTGSAGSDDITAHSDGSSISGGNGADALAGGAGRDILRGDGGDDILEGGAGTDMAVWSGDLSDFDVTYDAGTETITITDRTAADGIDEGTDTVTGIETFTFNGASYTRDEMIVEAAQQANLAPAGINMTGGTVNETVADGGTIAAAYDSSGETVAILSTSDGNAEDSHTYALITDVSGKFQIVGSEIRVKSGEAIDFEQDQSFALTVESTDPFGESVQEELTLNVIDFEGRFTATASGADEYGTSEEDELIGGAGDDRFNGRAGDDLIEGGAGDDRLSAGSGDDTLRGGAGDDQLFAGDGTNLLDGGDDDDWLEVDATDGATTVIGGDGVDELDLDGAPGFDVTFTGDGAGSFAPVSGDGAGTFTGIEELDTSHGADTVDARATTAGMHIVAQEGDDVIRGGSGNDIIEGGDDSDEVIWTGDLSGFSVTYDGSDDSFTITDLNAADGEEGTDTITEVESFTFNGVSYTHAEMVTAAARQANTAPELDSFENLIANGDFNDGLNHWTVNGQVDHGTLASAAENDDDSYVQFGRAQVDGGDVSQSFATVVGETYTLSFDFAAWQNTNEQSMSVHVSGAETLLVATVQDDPSQTATYDTYSFTFTADSNETTIKFNDISDSTKNTDGFLDSVAVTAAADVNEDAAAGTTVATLAATDAQGDLISYQITDADGTSNTDSEFEIIGNEIQVRTGADLDFETEESHTIYVTASDAFDSSSPRAITITVNDVAEMLSLEDGGVSFTESGVTETQVTGGDGDDILNGIDLADTHVTAPTNFVTNGSFEDVEGAAIDTVRALSPSVSGWEDANGYSFEMHEDGYLGVDATDGRYWLDMNENYAPMDISQSIDGLDAGESYQLSFDAGKVVNASSIEMDVYFGGELIASIDPAEQDVMERYTFELSGGSGDGSDTLRFVNTGTHSNAGISLDNVQIVAAGDDVFEGGLGDDQINAGAGDDRAIWSGDLSDFEITYSSGDDAFTITDLNAGDGDEGTDVVTGVETFTFNGVDYTHADLLAVANTAPSAIVVTGGTVNETVSDGGTIATAYDPSGDTVATLATTDADSGDSHSYTIVSDPSEKFEIVGNEIRVKSGQVIDYETDESFDLTIRTTDQHGATHDQQVTINVVDFEGSYTATAAGETIIGTSEEDTITGTSGAEIIYGGDGDDVIDAGNGTDTVDGGEGSDTISIGNITSGGANAITDSGTSGTDTLYLWRNSNEIQSDFSAASGIEVIDGSQFGSTNINFVDTPANADFTDITILGAPPIIGTEFDDTITGSSGADEISGGSGDDTLKGGIGEDVISGDEGNDSAIWDGDLADFAISYNATTETFTITDLNAADGDEGTDTITGVENFSFNGVTYTAAEMETEAARQANTAPTEITFASGGSVNETVADGGNIDSAYDPSGSVVGTLATTDANGGDSHSYTLVADASNKFEIVGNEVRVKAGQEIDYETNESFDLTVRTTDQFGATHDETITINVTDFEGSHTETDDSGVTITGTSEEDTITGGDGDDDIYGGTGADTISAGSGRDQIFFEDGFGADVIDGGTSASNDVDGLNFSDLSAAVTVTTGTSEDGSVTDGTDTLTYSDIEYIFGTSFDDVFDYSASTGYMEAYGNGGYDVFIGGSGDDFGYFYFTDNTGVSFTGGGGSDHVEGTVDGEDVVDGGTGNDSLNTYDGDDVLYGGEGDDFMLSFAGDDAFTGGAGDDRIIGGDDTDTAIYSGDLADFSLAWDGSEFTITDLNTSDGLDEGTDTVSGIESFTFNGTTYTAAEMETEAAAQAANSAPASPSLASGGSVDENSGESTVVAALTATDADGDSLTYALTDSGGAPVADSNFEIVGNEIRVKSGADIDFESAESHDLYVTASDGLATSSPQAITVTVNDMEEVITLSDGGEVFEDRGETETSVSGGTGADQITGSASADRVSGGGGDDVIDGAGNGASVMILSIGGSDRDDINPEYEVYADGELIHTGEITWAQDGSNGFDSSQPGAFQDVTIALPSGTPSSVHVVFVNDYIATDDANAPGEDRNVHVDKITIGDTVFEGEDGVITNGGMALSDNALIWSDGSTVTFDTSSVEIGDVAVWDGDLADFAVTYDAGTDTFTITDLNVADGDEGTDKVTGIESLEFNGTSYTHAQMVSEATTQSNTAPGSPSVSSGGTVAENSATGTVVATLTATDADGETLSFDITDSSGTPVTDSNFEIVGNEIRVKSGADVDFERSESHVLYVTASDGIESSSPQSVTVTVTDTAEAVQLADGGVTFVDTDVAEISVTGGSGNDDITAHDDGSTLDGGAGNDVLTGGAGDDVITTGTGGDTVDGGEGSDTIYVSDHSGGANNDITDSGSSGTDRIVLTGSNYGSFELGTDLSGIEEIDGSGLTGEFIKSADGSDYDFSDIILTGVDEIHGGNGAETITGSAGTDHIKGFGGDDVLSGGQGDDTIEGWDGSDTLLIGANEGSDTFDGGSGWTDIVALQDISGTATVSGNTIDGEGWTLVLDAGTATVAASGDQLDLSADASGLLTFDAGGSADLSGIERVTW